MKAKPVKRRCKACGGSGRASKGGRCLPCNGTGWQKACLRWKGVRY